MTSSTANGSPHRHQVAILQRRLVQYRLTLFERLRVECAERGIDLRIVYGQASATDQARNDGGSLPWADEVNARWFRVGKTDLVWQSFPRSLHNADLVILTQEIKILSNYARLFRQVLGRGKVAYWGHGRNLQSTNPEGLRERWKAMLSTKIDWWFAYTEGTADILKANGYPADQITCLNNAIDDELFTADLASIDDETLNRLRAEIDLEPGAPLGLYCGALYEEKRIDLLIEAADRIHEARSDFRLVVVGDGPDRAKLDAAFAVRPWARCLGTQTGRDKAAWFRLATVQISPGLVGLHVLDSFIAGVPLITTASALHGPEIDYLDNGVNGIISEADPSDRSTFSRVFADDIIELLSNRQAYESMVEAGRKAAEQYTMANMISNFVDGICRCLDIAVDQGDTTAVDNNETDTA